MNEGLFFHPDHWPLACLGALLFFSLFANAYLVSVLYAAFRENRMHDKRLQFRAEYIWTLEKQLHGPDVHDIQYATLEERKQRYYDMYPEKLKPKKSRSPIRVNPEGEVDFGKLDIDKYKQKIATKKLQTLKK